MWSLTFFVRHGPLDDGTIERKLWYFTETKVPFGSMVSPEIFPMKTSSGVVTFGRCSYFMFILKFPLPDDYENCTGDKTVEDSPFILLRNVGNFIWLGTMFLVFVVLSFTHFSQLRMDERMKGSFTTTELKQVVPRDSWARTKMKNWACYLKTGDLEEQTSKHDPLKARDLDGFGSNCIFFCDRYTWIPMILQRCFVCVRDMVHHGWWRWGTGLTTCLHLWSAESLFVGRESLRLSRAQSW